MYQKKEKNILQKMSPQSQLNVAMAHRNYFRRKQSVNPQIGNIIQRLKIIILGANWQLFRLERIAKCSYFVYTKHQVSLNCNENKEISVANLMIQ